MCSASSVKDTEAAICNGYLELSDGNDYVSEDDEASLVQSRKASLAPQSVFVYGYSECYRPISKVPEDKVYRQPGDLVLSKST